jgi:hypothetical protein
MEKSTGLLGMSALMLAFGLFVFSCASSGSAASPEKSSINSPFEGVWFHETDEEIVRYTFSGNSYFFDRNGFTVEKGTFTYTDTTITTKVKNVYLGGTWIGVDGLNPYTMNYHLAENNLTLEGKERRTFTKQEG